MMIRELIEVAFSTTSTFARPLSRIEVEDIVRTIVEKYTEPTIHDGPLWEVFQKELVKRRSDGWSLICDYQETDPILLFNELNEFTGYQFTKQEDVRTVLSETPHFDFFITNAEAEFVLCYNHHDFIISVGESNAWLSEIKSE